MSFYGSTYYQLIDAFSKIIIKNNSIPQFPVGQPNEETIEAMGRNSELKLSGGNKWIKIINNNGQIEIWHGDPNGGAIGGSFKTIQKGTLPDGAAVIQLNDGDYLVGTSVKYDAAGHIMSENETNQYYQLPIRTDIEIEFDELTDQVNWLESQINTIEPLTTEINNIKKYLYEDNDLSELSNITNELNDMYGDYQFFGIEVDGQNKPLQSVPKSIGNLRWVKERIESISKNYIDLLNNYDLGATLTQDNDGNYYYKFEDFANALYAFTLIVEENNKKNNERFSTINLALAGVDSKINDIYNTLNELDDRLSNLE